MLIAVAMVLLVRLDRRIVAGTAGDGAARRLAIASLVCWGGAIFAGRFLAYTYTRLTAIY